ncbi:MAG TPA: sugar phosphate isomerase/epimerase family protein [Pirellulales bacterium]|nr:sugar phosphate isomerase/epimerase family protein [Pirellulales bacterium]
MMEKHNDIRIGTIVFAEKAVAHIPQMANHGFESFQLTFGHQIGELDVESLADQLCKMSEDADHKWVISAIGIYGNPLANEQVASDWLRLIETAGRFGCNLVTGFAGRIPDTPVPECIPRFRDVFQPLAEAAEEHNIRLAFENCEMGGDWLRGDWNIAHSPTAWELMFDAVPSEAIGLEWEPCHQLVSFVDPLPQLRQWLPKVFHIHGKDATVLWDEIHRSGIRGGQSYVYHRTPGFGDTNWTDVISILRLGGFQGSIDIEGWHDPVYRDDLEMTGQVHALRYLKQCRGGDYVPNPDQ